MGTGAEWLLKLDSNVKGATDVIAVLGKTETAADHAEKMIDRALSRMDRAPKALKDAFATAKSNSAAERASQAEAKRAFREAQDIKLRTLVASQQLVEMEGQHGKAAESTWKEMFKGELAFHALAKGAELAWHGVEKIGEVMLDAFKLAAGSERSGKVWENVLGSKEERDEYLEYLEEFSRLSEFTDDAIKPMALSLLDVGMRGDLFKASLEAVTDVASRSTNKIEAMTAATESLARIQRTGMVNNRTIGGLGLDPHLLNKQLSKDLGMAPDIIKKKLEEGGLKGADAMGSIFRTLMAKTGRDLGETSMEMSGLVGAKLEKIADVPEELFKSMKNTEGFKSMSGALDGVLEAFGPESATFKEIKAGLSDLFDEVGKTIKKIDWKEVGGTIAYMVSATKEWIEPLTKVLTVMEHLVGAIVSLPKMGNAIGDWFARTLNPELDQESMMDKERRAKGQIEFDRMNEAAFKENDVAEAMARKSGERLARAQVNGAKDETQTKSPSKVWAKFGRDQAEGLALGMEASAPRIAVATDSMVAVPSLGSMGAGIGSGGFNAGGVTANFVINVPGSSASPDDIARELSIQVPSMLLSALEQLAIQGGTA
jgi:hypothetical protein